MNLTQYTPLVERIGARALPLYLMALPALLLVVAGLWALVRRYAVPRDDSTLPPPAFLLVRLAFGFAVVVGGAWLFAELAEQLGDPGDAQRLGALDDLLSAAVGRNLPPLALQFFANFTHLADTATLSVLGVGVAAALVWRGRRWLALGWVVAVAGNAVLNVTLKGILSAPARFMTPRCSSRTAGVSPVATARARWWLTACWPMCWCAPGQQP